MDKKEKLVKEWVEFNTKLNNGLRKMINDYDIQTKNLKDSSVITDIIKLIFEFCFVYPVVVIKSKYMEYKLERMIKKAIKWRVTLPNVQ